MGEIFNSGNESWEAFPDDQMGKGRGSNVMSPVILVVTRHARLTEAILVYGLTLARRLERRLLVAYVNTLPLLSDGGVRTFGFVAAVRDDIARVKTKADELGVTVDCVEETGKISKVVSRLCRMVSKIEFVLMDKGIRIDDKLMRIPVPIFDLFRTGYEHESVQKKHMSANPASGIGGEPGY